MFFACFEPLSLYLGVSAVICLLQAVKCIQRQEPMGPSLLSTVLWLLVTRLLYSLAGDWVQGLERDFQWMVIILYFLASLLLMKTVEDKLAEVDFGKLWRKK